MIQENVEQNKLPIIELFGDVEECFYQLGLKDKGRVKEILRHIFSLLGTRSKTFNTIIHETIKQVLAKTMSRDKFYNNLSAYAEGLDHPFEDILFAFLIPELMCCLSKWMPSVHSSMFGCSSFFALNESGNPLHFRVLDFPLAQSYDSKERVVKWKVRNDLEIFSLGTSGLPYPSITAMTNKGVTLAIHQKFLDKLNLKGESIFEIAFEVLTNSNSAEDALNFLKTVESFSSWGIYMSFPDKKVLACDLMGAEVRGDIYALKPGDILYFNNMPEDPSFDQGQYIPYGLKDYNIMRRTCAIQKIEKLKQFPKLCHKDFFTEIASPYLPPLYEDKDWNLDCITPSSMLCVSFNAKEEECYFVSGSAPKIYNGNAIKISKCFSGLIQEFMHEKNSRTPLNYKQGMMDLIYAQRAQDLHDIHKNYHHLQMAIGHFEDFPIHNIAQFYFLVSQFIHDKHRRVRARLLEEFKAIKTNLPPYLKDQSLLFIMRLEKILGNEITVKKSEITNKKLQSLYEFEQKMPKLFFHQIISSTMNPRIELLDIIYGHQIV
ncbi:MAG: hypothetical protein H6622_05650 [Halobacteriovoraceae bacterium]|nr:hypothetical protein [Halobacteriovoraceae bacterium]